MLYVLYTSEIYSIIHQFGLKVHGYADDLQIYGHTILEEADALAACVSACIEEVKRWMTSNRLCLNPSKTELIWFGSKKRGLHCPDGVIEVSGSSIKPSSCVRNLGVLLDSDLTMIPQVNALVRSCYFNIRQLRVIRRSLNRDAAHALVRAMIHSRLDYCNGLLTGLPLYIYNRLQLVLKSAARLVLKQSSSSSVSDSMRTVLHWLPFPQRITYKSAIITYRCLHGIAPLYLAERLVPLSGVSGRSRLRSAGAGMLQVPQTETKTIGIRGFHVAGPVAWNALSGSNVNIRDSSLSLDRFRRHLKTVLFDS